MRIKLAAVLAFVLFVALAGGGVAEAYWLSQVSASSKVQVASLASNCTPATKLGNGSFETPVIPASSYQQGAVAPWSTTDTRGIELWSSGFNGVLAQVGKQFVELNAESAGTLWQDIPTTEGQTIRWSLLHRAREGVDTMRVSLGPAGFSGGVSQGTYSATTSSWVRHEGTYTVPTGQTMTRFSMTAVSTGSGNPTIGNFIDDVSFGSGPCLKPVSSVTNTSRPLSGTRVGDVLDYATTVTNTGGSQALTSSLSAILPVGIQYQPDSLKINGAVPATGLVGYDAAARKLTVQLGLNASATTGGSIAPDQIMTVTFTAVATALGLGSSVDYVATAGYTDYLAPGWPQSADSAPVGFTVVAADLAVAVLSTPTITAGSTAVWTFSLTNGGPSSSAGVNVVVTIPAGVTAATVTRTTANNGTGSQTCAGTPVTCSFGTLNSGDTRTITLSGTVSSVQASYASTATASATTYDHVAANNTATSTAIPDIISAVVPGQWYSISYPFGGLCVGTPNTDNNTPLQIVTCDSSDVKQQWRFEERQNGYYNVVPRYDTSRWNNDSMWDISGNSARVNESSGNNDDQRWMPIVTQLNGTSFIGFQHRDSTKCLDVPGSAKKAGTQLQRYDCNSSTAQSFLLTPVP